MGAAGGLVNFPGINPSTPTPILKRTQPPTRSRCLIYHSARGYQCVKHMQWPDCKCTDPISHVTGARQRLHEEQVWWEDTWSRRRFVHAEYLTRRRYCNPCLSCGKSVFWSAMASTECDKRLVRQHACKRNLFKSLEPICCSKTRKKEEIVWTDSLNDLNHSKRLTNEQI